MRAIATLTLMLALSAMTGGCAVTGKLGLRFVSDPAIVVEGLRGQQTEAQWVHQAQLATPPGCAVEGIRVLTDMDATFTFTCFSGGATVSGL